LGDLWRHVEDSTDAYPAADPGTRRERALSKSVEVVTTAARVARAAVQQVAIEAALDGAGGSHEVMLSGGHNVTVALVQAFIDHARRVNSAPGPEHDAVEGAYRVAQAELTRLVGSRTQDRLRYESWRDLVDDFVDGVNHRAWKDAPTVWERFQDGWRRPPESQVANDPRLEWILWAVRQHAGPGPDAGSSAGGSPDSVVQHIAAARGDVQQLLRDLGLARLTHRTAVRRRIELIASAEVASTGLSRMPAAFWEPSLAATVTGLYLPEAVILPSTVPDTSLPAPDMTITSSRL
jgi:hypothetical protein